MARRSRPAAASGGIRRAASCRAVAFLKLTVPDRLSSHPASRQSRAIWAVRGEAVEDHVAAAHPRRAARRAPRGRRRGCGSSAACRCAWPGRCAMRTRHAASAGSAQPSSRPGQYRSRPVSPTATTRGSRASDSMSAFAASVSAVGAGGVKRHRGVHPRVGVRGRHHPARGRQVVGDRDDGLDAHRLGAVHDRAHAVGVTRAARVEMRVRVDQRAQRLRWRRRRTGTAHCHTIRLTSR